MTDKKFKYFKLKEFDSPDQPGSGAQNMDLDFIALLDEARHIAKKPFKINSGWRSPEHNIALAKRGYKVAKNSAHLRGLAADISVRTSSDRYLILDALFTVGFRRFGIGKGFIHVDADDTKTPNLIWHYY